MPVLHASPFALLRAGLRWLRRDGDAVLAREPIAYAHVGLRASRDSTRAQPFAEESMDLQVALAPGVGGILRPDGALSRGGFQDVVSSIEWDDGALLGALEQAEEAEVVPLVLAGRRGFDAGEGRGDLLPGWHDRTRAFWGVDREGPAGTVLSLGICEQTGLFRGDRFAYLEWFAAAPGPAQIIAVPDERTVHSSAVLLQHLRRTPAEAAAIADAVHGWIGERVTGPAASYPAFGPAAHGAGQGRWPDGQSTLFALGLLSAAVGASPLTEHTDLFGKQGLTRQGPPQVAALSLGAELTSHFRHRKTGWLVALHDYRLQSFVGPAFRDWLKRDFERVTRTVDDVRRDLSELSRELAARTGGVLVVQNLIATSVADQIFNYAWLGDDFSTAVPVACAEVNAMLWDLTRDHDMSVLDADALAAEHGGRHCADRAHPDRVLLDAERAELHRILRERRVPGF
jgi:hypothetical protein